MQVYDYYNCLYTLIRLYILLKTIMKFEIFIIYVNRKINFIRSIFYYVRIKNDKFVAI